MSVINSPIVNNQLVDEQFNRSNQIRNNIYANFPPNCIILGLGGIGSNVAPILASIKSVANIVLFDDDVVEMSNLPRTVYQYRHEGRYKTEALAEIISSRNISPNIYPLNMRFNQETCDRINGDDELDFIKYSDFMVFDCRDDFYGDYNLFNGISERENQFSIIRAAYNEMGITIDPNPAIHPVWGRSGYNENTASHSIPAKLSALLIVMVAAQYSTYKTKPVFTIPLTFNVNEVMDYLFNGMIIDKLNEADKNSVNTLITNKITSMGSNTSHTADEVDEVVVDDAAGVNPASEPTS